MFFLVSLVFVISQVWLDLKLPDYMSEITKLVETEGSAMADIWSAGGKMLLCSLGSLASSIIVCFLASRIAASFSRRLRGALFDKVESFSMEEINSFSTASLITRSTNDVVQVQMLIVLSMQVVIKAPAMAIWAITKIAGKAWQWSLATGIAVALISAILAIAMVLTFPKFRRVQWLQDALNHAARENLNGIRVVRAYNAEEYQEKKFEKANTDLLENQLFANRAMTLLSPFMNITMNCLNMSIYWIGAVLINAVVINGAASIAQRVDIFADMIVFMSYAMQVIMTIATYHGLRYRRSDSMDDLKFFGLSSRGLPIFIPLIWQVPPPKAVTGRSACKPRSFSSARCAFPCRPACPRQARLFCRQSLSCRYAGQR